MKKLSVIVVVVMLLCSACTSVDAIEDGSAPTVETLPALREEASPSSFEHTSEEASYDPFWQLPGMPEEIETQFSLEKLKEVVRSLEDHYADIYKEFTIREWLILDIIKITLIDDIVYMEYDFYEIAENWSLRIGTVCIVKDDRGQPSILSDEIDEAAMDTIETAKQEWVNGK